MRTRCAKPSPSKNGEKNREEYLQKLRNEAYIKIADNYRAAVAPLLKLAPEKDSRQQRLANH